MKAGNETRTRDIQLGKLTLYQLSYTRGIEKRVSRGFRGASIALPRHVKQGGQFGIAHGQEPLRGRAGPLVLGSRWRYDNTNSHGELVIKERL